MGASPPNPRRAMPYREPPIMTRIAVSTVAVRVPSRPVIKLHKFGPAFGLPDASPFVVKVETYLRMSGQKYEVVTGDVRKAPRGQLPFVEIDGTRIPDSTAIIEFLDRKSTRLNSSHLGISYAVFCLK